MATQLPQNREQLKDWCLEKLGAGVIKINVSDEQVESRVTEAIERFQEHHFDGVEKIHMQHKITASVMTFVSPLAFTFQPQERIEGDTSGAKGVVHIQATDSSSIQFVTDTGTFVPGETVTGASGTSGAIATNGVVLGDKDNRYIPIDDSIISIREIVPFSGFFGGGLFSLQFQQAIQALPIWPKGDLSYYYQQRQYSHLIEEIFVGQKAIQFSRITNKLYIDMDWRNQMNVDQYIIIECEKAINPTTYKKLYANYFVREFTIALIMEQWAQNMSKHKNIVMPGGVTLAADDLMRKAEKKIAELEKRLRDEFQLPPGFFIG